MKTKRCIGPKWQQTWSCDLLRVGLNKVVWAYPQVTWSMLIWRTRITQFLPLASSLLLLPPSSPHPTTNGWGCPSEVPMAISNSSSRGSRCRCISSLGEFFFFILFFFGSTNNFFIIRLCVPELQWRRRTHTISKHWKQKGLEMCHISSPCCFQCLEMAYVHHCHCSSGAWSLIIKNR